MHNSTNPVPDPHQEEILQKFGQYAWQNGQVKPIQEARVHMLSHAVQYGTGAFEGIRCHKTVDGPAIFRLQDHMKRFQYSMQCLRLAPPHSVEEIAEGCRELIRRNGFDECYLRPFVYSGLSDLGLTPSPLEAGIATRPWSGYYDNLRGQVSDVRRLSPRAFTPDAKITGHYVNSINADADARAKRPGSTAVLLDPEGYLAEASSANIFLALGDELHTPQKGSILPGLTRDTLLTLAEAEGVKVVERNIAADELLKADELFVTGTAAGVMPMIEVNGTLVNSGVPGKYATRFSTLYQNVVQGRAAEYKHWLTHVRE